MTGARFLLFAVEQRGELAMFANRMNNRPWMRTGNVALRLYVCAFLAGCAGAVPPPTVEETRSMETRIVHEDFTGAFNASVDVLMDTGYTLDVVNTEAGLITAFKKTTGEQGRILEERGPDEAETPTWVKVLGCVLVVGLVVAVVAAIADGDEDECCEYRCRDDDPDIIYIHDDGDFYDNATVYEYNVNVNLSAGDDENYTHIRVSCQGARMEGGRLVEAGPVYDPGLFARFFADMNTALALEETGF